MRGADGGPFKRICALSAFWVYFGFMFAPLILEMTLAFLFRWEIWCLLGMSFPYVLSSYEGAQLQQSCVCYGGLWQSFCFFFFFGVVCGVE